MEKDREKEVKRTRTRKFCRLSGVIVNFDNNVVVNATRLLLLFDCKLYNIKVRRNPHISFTTISTSELTIVSEVRQVNFDCVLYIGDIDVEKYGKKVRKERKNLPRKIERDGWRGKARVKNSGQGRQLRHAGKGERERENEDRE